MKDAQTEAWKFNQAEISRYDRVSRDIPGHRVSAEITANIIKDKFAGKTINSWLDLGTGTGNSLIDILKHRVVAGKVFGVDKSHAWLMAAADKAKKQELNPTLVNADGLKLPFASESFDCISAIQAMHWMMLKSSPEATFAELNRVLKPGGLLVFDESAYHLKFEPEVNYPVTIIEQNGKQRLSNPTGKELSQRWFFESIGDLVLRGLMQGKTIAEIYQDKHGFHSFDIAQLTQALSDSGFKTETLTKLLLYKPEEMRDSLAYDYKNLLSLKREDRAKKKIGSVLNQIDNSNLRNKGEILVHWTATKK